MEPQTWHMKELVCLSVCLSDSGSLPVCQPVCVSVSLKGETLCSVKDFRINVFVPGAEDMIILSLGSAESRLLLDKRPAESLQQQGEDEP